MFDTQTQIIYLNEDMGQEERQKIQKIMNPKKKVTICYWNWSIWDMKQVCRKVQKWKVKTLYLITVGVSIDKNYNQNILKQILVIPYLNVHTIKLPHNNIQSIEGMNFMEHLESIALLHNNITNVKDMRKWKNKQIQDLLLQDNKIVEGKYFSELASKQKIKLHISTQKLSTYRFMFKFAFNEISYLYIPKSKESQKMKHKYPQITIYDH